MVATLQMGGLTAMGQLLQSYEDSQVRRLAAWVIGNSVKYNVHVQQNAVKSGLLRLLLTQLNHTVMGVSSAVEDAPAVAGKLLYATSALLRGSPFAQVQFAALDGPTLLLQLLHQPTAAGGQWRRVAAKAAALLGDLSAEVRDRVGDASAGGQGGTAGDAAGAVEMVQLDHKTRAVHSVGSDGATTPEGAVDATSAGASARAARELGEALHTASVCEALVEALDAAQAHVESGVAAESVASGATASDAGRRLRQALQWRDQVAQAVASTARDSACLATFASPPVRPVLEAVVARVDASEARAAADSEGSEGDPGAVTVAALLRRALSGDVPQ